MKSIIELKERIGLDRTVIAGFRIVRIDFLKLNAHNNVTCEREGQFTYLLEDGNSFRWLKIEDHNMFGIMCAGVKKTKHIKQDYSRMDITIGNKTNGNLQNMTVDEYKNKIYQVFVYLYEEYGISVRLDNLRFSEMEINCTFELKDEFYKYHRILHLLMYNLPKSFRKVGRFASKNKKKNRIEEETFYSGNSLMEAKIYDKKRHLEQTIQFEAKENIMRIEFVLKKSQKINEVFNSTLVSELTDEKLNEFYFFQFVKLFEKPYRRWQINNRKQLKNLIIQHKAKSKNFWKNNLLRECSNIEQINQIPMLLDVKDLLVQVKELDKHGHYTRVEASIIEQCKYNNVYLQNDADKIDEIIDKIYDAYNNYLNGIKKASILHTPTSGEVA